MQYRMKSNDIEAVFFDSLTTALVFLRPGDYNVIGSNYIYILTDYGNEKVTVNTGYLIRRGGKIGFIEKDFFEDTYEEAR